MQDSQTLAETADLRIRIRAAVISLTVSFLLLLVKFFAYHLTGSKAVFSDAMESIVNVVAACVALYALWEGSKPADREHPYGHGKLESFSSVFEGGLVSFAGAIILIEAVQSFFSEHTIRQMDLGLALIVVAGLINGILGVYLVQVGRYHKSQALEASGKHILSDFQTSVGVIIGLMAVWFTGEPLVDSIIAALVGLFLSYSGFKIFRKSVGVLIDETDEAIISELGGLFSKYLFPGMIRIHAVRVMRSGRYHHIDGHIVVPEFWDVETAHKEIDRFEQKILRNYSQDGELHFHVDPCRRRYCKVCDFPNCPVRVHPFETKIPFSVKELVDPNEPEKLI